MIMYDNRRYLIIPTSITGSLNFNEIHETSKDTLRISLDGTKTFIKYDISVRESDIEVNQLNSDTGLMETITLPAGTFGRPSIFTNDMVEYTHEQILEILKNQDWSKPILV